MTSDFQRIVSALDKLSPDELLALLPEITARLRPSAGTPPDDLADDTDDAPRRYLPRLPQMITWGLVMPMEDTLVVRDHPAQPALLLDANRVAFQGETMGINDWAKHVTGWKSINVYEWVIVKRAGRTLDDLRREYMRAHGIEE